ncbi:hypothetical protein JXB31_02565 [Candidatus Woesearchaeota archaeon]|nr:hypothetical protein [Candidatus Woesearchaeota archaeon]
MKVRKAIKKIAALTGATLMGATMMGGAMAADLSEYPNMFIKDGQFDGILVIGENADAIDNMGVTNIAMALQAAAVTRTEICSSATASTTTVSEGVKIQTSSNKFNFGEDMEDIMPTLDDGDLPEVLATETYDESEGNTKNDVEYTQRIDFTNGTGILQYAQDDDDAPAAQPYVFFDDGAGKFAYTYTLEFDTPVEFDNVTSGENADDLESTTLKIQGQTYTITDAHFHATTGVLDKVTMMVGETIMWMSEGDQITKTIDGTDHTIKMVDVADSTPASCGFEIDGTSIWIDKDKTETVSGVTVGVTDVKTVHAKDYDADICKVNLGASELILEEGQEVNKDGSDVDGSDVTLSSADPSTGGSWTGITITWLPDDNIYLSAEEDNNEILDPVFGNFKFVFGGVVADYEQITFDVSSEDGDMKFVNTDGKEVTIPLAADEATDTVYFGKGITANKRLYFGAGHNTTLADMTDATASTANCMLNADNDVRNCEGAMWLLVTGKEAHVIKLKDIDVGNAKIDFEDLTYGTTDTGNDYTAGTDTPIYIAGIGTVNVYVNSNADNATVGISNGVAPTAAETKYGAKIEGIASAADRNNVTVKWKEEAGSGGTASDIEMTIVYDDGSDDSLEIENPVFTLGAGTEYGALNFDADDDDNKIYATNNYGSYIEFDSKNRDSLVINHPSKQVYAELYVTPTGAAVTVNDGSSAGCQVSETVNKIPSSVNKFDKDVTDVTAQNIITVGGPCANSVTSALMGNPEVCYEGFEAGQAMIKLIESGDKVALIVAGASGEDTWRASKIMQNYDQYTLTGKEMVATTVSEAGLSVTPVTVTE